MPESSVGESAFVSAPAPLAGVRVVELASMGPGPFAATMLADLGADVIRVERPATGPQFPARFNVLNRSRPHLVLDLRTRDGVDQVLDLVEHADVLIEGNRPGVTERLGVGPKECWDRNPRLVYGRMTGWGQEGPLAHTAGHDLTYLAISGALHPIGPAGGPPVFPVNLLGDYAGGSLYLVVGLLAGLWEARQTGRGREVDAAIVDGAASLTAMLHGLLAADHWTSERGTNLLDGGVPWYDVYPTADGQWIAIGALEPKFFAELCRLLPLEATEDDRADRERWPAMREAIATRVRERSRDEWAEYFADTDACVAPVLTPAEAADNPHLQARGTFTERSGVTQPSPAPRFDRLAPEIRGDIEAPPVTVQEVLSRWQP